VKRIVDFKGFVRVNEQIDAVTSNWFIINGESGFPKKVEGGFLVLHNSGSFSITYKKSKDEEAKIVFYNSSEDSENKKTSVSCQILGSNEDDVKERKDFDSIDSSNFIEILCVFFDYCDLEKAPKEQGQRFMMGLSKSLKALMKSDEKSALPSSFKAFYNYIEKSKSKEEIKSEPSDDYYDFIKIVEDFFKYHGKDF
jgi:hypothetical protein